MNKSLVALLFVSLLGTYGCSKSKKNKPAAKAEAATENGGDEQTETGVLSVEERIADDFSKLIFSQTEIQKEIRAELQKALTPMGSSPVISERKAYDDGGDIEKYMTEVLKVRFQDEFLRMARKYNKDITDIQVSFNEKVHNWTGFGKDSAMLKLPEYRIKLEGYTLASSENGESSICLDAEDINTVEVDYPNDLLSFSKQKWAFSKLMAKIVTGKVTHGTGSVEEQEDYAKKAKKKVEVKEKLAKELVELALHKKHFKSLYETLEVDAESEEAVREAVEAQAEESIVALSNAFGGNVKSIDFTIQEANSFWLNTIFGNVFVSTIDGETEQMGVKNGVRADGSSFSIRGKTTADKEEIAEYLSKIIATPRK